MSAYPQIHDGYGLPCVRYRRVPFPLHDRSNQPLHLPAGHDLLRLIGPEDACPHCGGHQRLDMTHHEGIRRLVQRQADDGANDAKQRREVRRSSEARHRAAHLVGGSGAASTFFQQSGEFAQNRQVSIRWERAPKRPLPDGQQRAALSDAGPPADGAHDGRIELVVQAHERVGVLVGSEHKRQRG